jgi:hypothetical protein
MDRSLGKIVLLSLVTIGATLVLSASSAFAQEAAGPAPASAPTTPTDPDGGGHKHGHHHHHKGGIFLGMCVERALEAQTPPVVIQFGQKLTKEQRKANWAIIKPVKDACKAQFKASRAANKGQ